MSSVQDHRLGLWYGTTPSEPFAQYTELLLFTRSAGAPDNIHLQFNSRYYETRPSNIITWSPGSGNEFSCNLPHYLLPSNITIRCKFTDGDSTLLATFSGGMSSIESYTVALHLSDPHCLKYQRPAASLSYTYRVPELSPPEEASFFPPADAATTPGLSAPLLTATVNALLRLDNGAPDSARCDGILVLKDSHVVLEEYFWGFDASADHEISSCTKSIASLLIGIALDHGLVCLDDIVADAFPSVPTTWNSPDRPPVRLVHILSMASGTVFDDSNAASLLLTDNIPALVLSAPRTTDPGEVYAYDNSLPFLVGCYLEAKTQLTVPAFAQKYLFDPLGIPAPRWFFMQNQRATDGSPMAMLSGGMRLTLRNFAKLGVLVQNFGLFKGRRVVSEKYVRLATSRFSKEGQWPYGLYFHLSCEDMRHLHAGDGAMMLGQGEQVCGVFRERGLVIVWMSSTWVNHFGYRVAMRTIDEEWFLKDGTTGEGAKELDGARDKITVNY